jgi:Zn finger protein HypA/HybF involved in hydrogenase expression
VGLHSDEMPMVCKHCKRIDLYTKVHPGGNQHSISNPPVCAGCHSSEYLHEWDGLTCPKCNKYMRALGGDVDAEKLFKYW